MKFLHGFLLAALAAVAQSTSQRIVGGVLAEINSVPYQVALQPRKAKVTIPLICGGSIISETAILTAAHCLKDSVKAYVAIGAYNLTDDEDGVYKAWVNASDYRVHPDFNYAYAYNDIAMLLLRRPVEFSERIRAVALPTTDESYVDEIGTISGYGNTCDDCSASLLLKVAQNKVLQKEVCSKIFGTVALPTATQICVSTAETKSGICRGDSGEVSFVC